MRAVSEDRGAAELMGINVNRTISMTFAIGSALAAVAGILYICQYQSLRPTLGALPGIKAFVAAVLGGIGSVTGSVLGSFVVTAGREALRFFDDPLTIAGIHIPLFRSGFRMVIFSILLMAVVLFYSRGIMGNKEFSLGRAVPPDQGHPP